MRRLPRRPNAPIMDSALVFRIALVGLLLLAGSFGLFEWKLHQGAGELHARTVAVNVFVFGELFYLFNCRSLTRSMFRLGVLFSNRWLLVGVGFMIGLQLAFTYAPPMQRVFQSAPLTLADWGLILLSGR